MSFTLILKNDFRALNVENISYVRKILLLVIVNWLQSC